MGQPELSEAFDATSIQGLDNVFSAAPVLEPVTGESKPVPAPVLEPVTSESEPVPAPVLEPVTIPIEQAASILGTSVAALKKRLRRGSIRGTKAETKHGEKWFVDASELPTEPIPAPVTSELKHGPEPVLEPVTNGSEPVPAPVLEPVTGELEPVPEPDTVDVEPVPELTPYNAEYQRLMSIIESQAHQLKAAGDVIVYLRSEVDDAKSQVKLLTDSQHKSGWWDRFCSWFSPRP